MELVYFWVEDFKNIKKQGFNFSSRFDCAFDYEKNELTIDPKAYVQVFPNNIQVTAIAGKNGSGKSSLIEALVYFRTERFEGFTDSNAFLVYENDGQLFILDHHTNHSHHFENYQSKFQRLKNNTEYSVYENDYIYNYDNFFEFSYFSNAKFDFTHQKEFIARRIPTHLEGLYKGFSFEEGNEVIDFNYKLLKILKLFPSFFRHIDYAPFTHFQIYFDTKPFQFHLDSSFFGEENKKQLEELHDLCGIGLAELLFGNLGYGEKLEALADEKNLLFHQMVASYILDEIIGFIRNFSRELDTDRILGFFFRKCNENLQKPAQRESFGAEEKTLDIYLENSLLLIKNVERFLSVFQTEVDRSDSEHLQKVFKHDKKHRSVFIILRHYKTLLSIFEKLYPNGREISESYTIEGKEANRFSRFIEKRSPVFEQFRGRFTLDFFQDKDETLSFEYLSSGEKVFIKYLVDFTYTNLVDWKESNRIFLNDEIDQSFHPEWQRKITYYMIHLLEAMREKSLLANRKFHIINVTHSPFMLSDIPKQNILFLDRTPEGLCKVVKGLDKEDDTFGANIHLLLSDAFFMENGLMGEFAKQWINEVIEYLNYDKPTKRIQNLEMAQKIIDLIGEPVIKNQLQIMIDEKYPDDIRIKRLEEEIARLRGKNEKNRD